MVKEDARSVSDESESDEGEWLDVEPDEEAVTVVSLFDEQTFTTVSAMLSHCKEKHNFDLVAVTRRLKLDFIGIAKLVNFVRSSIKEGRGVPAEVSNSLFEDDAYLKPTLENDALLFSLDEILESAADENASGQEDAAALLARNRDLEDELEAMRNQFANYRLTVEETLDKRWGDDAEPAPKPALKDSSEYYWESYAAYGEEHFRPEEAAQDGNADHYSRNS